MKVSQAVSSEIVLDKLIDTLMRTAIEHAGAERGLLILLRGDEQQLEAEATTSGDTVVVRLREASVTALPESIVHWVARTRESVILDDASVRNTFSADTYIGQHHARSILCLPLINQTNLIGVLYLENNLTPYVFTPTRIAALKLLASQAAISLENTRLFTERKRTEQALEDLAGRLIHAQEEERSRIGRELHDHVSQTLGLLTIKIDQLRDNAETTAGIAAALEELRRNTSALTDDVHRLSHRLHSSTLDYLGLVPALQNLVAEFSERHGVPIAFTHTLLPAAVPSEVALCLFRVAEESLANIAKHSKARSARVDIADTSDGIHLTVEDAGEGFDVTSPEIKAGLGLVSMQERLRILHGTIRVDSTRARGTRIDAWIPPIGASPR
jgi:signal transduction histidine kinase